MAHNRQNVDWNIDDSAGNTTWEKVPIAVLMDIRAELRKLNGTMYSIGCIHSTLKGLRRDIQKARRNHRRKV